MVFAENHLGVSRSIFLPLFVVESGDFVVYQFLDIRLWYAVWGIEELSHRWYLVSPVRQPFRCPIFLCVQLPSAVPLC